MIAPIYCMSEKVDKHLKEALDNIREDRKITRELLDDADRKSTRLNSSHSQQSRMPSSA